MTLLTLHWCMICMKILGVCFQRAQKLHEKKRRRGRETYKGGESRQCPELLYIGYVLPQDILRGGV